MKKNKMKSQVRDLTTGSIPISLLLFALPLFGSSLIQQLYNGVDLIFVGNIIGKEASAAVGSGSLLISCIIDFFIGLGVGVNIICAQLFGAGKKQELHIAIYTAMGLSIFAAIVLTIVGWIATPQILRWYRTPEQIYVMAVPYMRIYFLSLPAIIIFNIGSGILRSLGNSRSPMISQLIGGFANIFCNTLFIYILKLGVIGAAFATMLSQTVAMLLVLNSMRKLPGDYRYSISPKTLFRFTEPWWSGQMLLRILIIGIPTAVQSMIITFSNLVIQTLINQLGVDSIAAYAAFYKVDAFAYMPLIAVGQALVTYTGQNYGAGRKDRLMRGIFVTWIFMLIISLPLAGSILFFHYPIYRLFLTDPKVIEIGYRIMLWCFPYYLLYGTCETLASSLRGAGYTFACMMIMLVNIILLRMPVVFALNAHFHSAPGIALTYPITWAANLICFSVLWWLKRDTFLIRKE